MDLGSIDLFRGISIAVVRGKEVKELLHASHESIYSIILTSSRLKLQRLQVYNSATHY